MTESADTISIPDHVLIQTVHTGEAVMLHLENESYYGLNEVGTRMIDLLVSGHSFERTVERLGEEYDTDLETLRRDMQELVDELEERGLVAVG